MNRMKSLEWLNKLLKCHQVMKSKMEMHKMMLTSKHQQRLKRVSHHEVVSKKATVKSLKRLMRLKLIQSKEKSGVVSARSMSVQMLTTAKIVKSASRSMTIIASSLANALAVGTSFVFGEPWLESSSISLTSLFSSDAQLLSKQAVKQHLLSKKKHSDYLNQFNQII